MASGCLTAGLDPYAIWISRCREKRISPWLSMRMNDVHSVDDPSHFLHSTFWREHPEYWRVPHGSAAPWVNRALNYAHAAVREHQMSFVRELLERYDADGLELDWMRFGYHLTPGREREEGADPHAVRARGACADQGMVGQTWPSDPAGRARAGTSGRGGRAGDGRRGVGPRRTGRSDHSLSVLDFIRFRHSGRTVA